MSERRQVESKSGLERGAVSSSRKRVLFLSTIALLTAALMELGSFVALSITGRSVPSPGRWKKERLAVSNPGAEATGNASSSRPPTGGGQAIHPFVGFVQDRDSPENPWQLTEQGFPSIPNDPPDGRNEGAFVVAIFGGSVANDLCTTGRGALIRELRKMPKVGGRTIAIRCYAIGGYKQPQQLMALNWALSLGEPLDLVISLSGFNEVALTATENLKAGVFPYYPRAWQLRIATSQSTEAMVKMGELGYLRQLRRKRAELCSAWPLSWSPTCHVLWRALDARLMSRLVEEEQALVSAAPTERTFLSFGPSFAALPAAETYRQLAAHWARSETLMYRACKSAGIPSFHFLQPNQYVAGSKPMGEEERRIAISDKQRFRVPVEEGYSYFIEAGKALVRSGVPFVDLTQLFAGTEEAVYADDCCHFNAHGNSALGRAIGDIPAEAQN